MSSMFERSNYESYDYYQKIRQDSGNCIYYDDYRHVEEWNPYYDEDVAEVCRELREEYYPAA